MAQFKNRYPMLGKIILPSDQGFHTFHALWLIDATRPAVNEPRAVAAGRPPRKTLSSVRR